MAEENVAPVEGVAEVTDDDKLWALLSWIVWPIAIIVLLMEDKKQRPFIKYNAVQSLPLGVVGWLISLVLSAIGIGCVLGVALLIYAVYLGIKAYQGEWVVIPWLTDFCKNQGWL